MFFLQNLIVANSHSIQRSIRIGEKPNGITRTWPNHVPRTLPRRSHVHSCQQTRAKRIRVNRRCGACKSVPTRVAQRILVKKKGTEEEGHRHPSPLPPSVRCPSFNVKPQFEDCKDISILCIDRLQVELVISSLQIRIPLAPVLKHLTIEGFHLEPIQ